jgi:DNA invertase Pin-like site-specific DNA recombinase
MIIGYARVSTTGQTRAAQIQTLQNAGWIAMSLVGAIIAAAAVVSSGDSNGVENEVVHGRAEPDAA